MPFSGKVKWFDPKKGIGFIERDDGSGDVFVHYSDVVPATGWRDLTAGVRVKFEVADSPKGKKATQVEKVESA